MFAFVRNGPAHVRFFPSLSLSNCRTCLTRAMRTEDVGWLFVDSVFNYSFTYRCF